MKHNVYFAGRVQSLSVSTDAGEATVGVITPGTYTFSTTLEEHIVVTTGHMRVKVPGADWQDLVPGESVVAPPACEFEVAAECDVSYVCHYSRHERGA